MRDGRTSVAGRVALGAVVLALLVAPGRLLAAEHAMDRDLVPFAGTVHARATTGETREIDARVVATVHEKLRLLEVRPRVAVDSAAADISILVCTAASGCADVTDAEGPRVRLAGPGAARLMISVTPHHAGEVRIDGFDVTYLDTGRRGTQHAGSALLVTVA
jgi:hypothetical protein